MNHEIPPKIPGNLQDFDRALMLLGNRSQGRDLKESRKRELKRLIGLYPSPLRAATYKHHLKKLRKSLSLTPPSPSSEVTEEMSDSLQQ